MCRKPLGFTVESLGFRVSMLRFRVSGPGFRRVGGLGLMDKSSHRGLGLSSVRSFGLSSDRGFGLSSDRGLEFEHREGGHVAVGALLARAPRRGHHCAWFRV